MPEFKLSPEAKNDLKKIGRYTSREWGLRQRNAYLAELDAHFCKLAENPNLGKSRDEVVAGLKSYVTVPQRRHIIFFRVTDAGIEIVRILHHLMDIEKHFGPDSNQT